MYAARDRSSELGPALAEHRDDLQKYLRDWMSAQDKIIEGILSSPERVNCSQAAPLFRAPTAGTPAELEGVGSANLFANVRREQQHSQKQTASEAPPATNLQSDNIDVVLEGAASVGSSPWNDQEREDGRRQRSSHARVTSIQRASDGSSKALAKVRASRMAKWSMNEKEMIIRANTAGGPRFPSTEEVINDLRRGHVRQLVLSKQFETCGAVVIIFNALFVGLQVRRSSQMRSNEQSDVVQIAHLVFCFLFSAELVLRMMADFPIFFFRAHRDWVWNWFDVVIVIASILEAIVYYARMFENVTFLLLVRIARMIRLVRFIRRGSFFRELRAMVYMIVHTLKSLVWSLVLLCTLMYIFSLVLTQAVTNFLILHPEGDDPSAPSSVSHRGLVRNFGSLETSMFCLLQSLTGGVSWREPAELLREVGEVYQLIFVVFIVFTLFAMLNVITGFFCENARDMAARDREHVIQEKLQDRERYMKEMHVFFKELDQNGDENLSLYELEMQLKSETVRAYLSSLQIDVTRVWDVFKLLDEDGSGTIDMQEFADGCLRLRGEAKSIDVEFIKFELAKLERNVQYFMAFVESQLEKVIITQRKMLATKQPTQHVLQGGSSARRFTNHEVTI